MLVQIYAIISLVVFIFCMFMGAAAEPTMMKSAMVFITLVVGTRLSTIVMGIIKESSSNEQNTTSTSP